MPNPSELMNLLSLDSEHCYRQRYSSHSFFRMLEEGPRVIKSYSEFIHIQMEDEKNDEKKFGARYLDVDELTTLPATN